ncbi:flagellar associated protein [Dunaliella salina]|uniref:Flagellar associated protein n=1 Tax=Dunaliella salina TaxID=3046 RepID=A0ABQ7FV92_DUNSA|nr:flagellar associated protein [Dunaliella salina]|eukprot:KAF5826304.1 flagellar associated protein [Dunaliella salina]
MGASSGGPYEFKLLGQTNTIGTEPSSAFGRQSPSRCRTAPAHKFGLRISNDTNMKLQQPGPGSYEQPSSLGKQPLSSHDKLPAYGMGSSGRFSHFKSEMNPRYSLTPSPADYETRPTSGWMGDAPKYSMYGRGHRADIARGLPGQKPSCLEDPGPGTYHNASSLGRQLDSRKESSPVTRIGTADRDRVRNTQFVSRELEHALYGKHSPAPNVYNPTKSLYQTSKVPKPATYRFGSSDRFSQIKPNDTRRRGKLPGFSNPGPGSYVP